MGRAALAGLLIAVGFGVIAGGAGAVAPTPPTGCIGTTTTFTQSTPLTIPSSGVVTSTLVVSGAGPFLADVDVQTFLAPFRVDLIDVTLTSPAGTVVTLTTGNGPADANPSTFNGTVWDDDANPGGQLPYSFNNGMVTEAPYNGFPPSTVFSPLTPEEPLAAFIGENPNGTWSLTIRNKPSSAGSLSSWSLTLTTYPNGPPIVTSSFTQASATAIPAGNNVVTSTVVVSGAGPSLVDIDVTTFLAHTWSEDLRVTLRSPAGTVVTLTTHNGFDFDNVFNGTVWDDDADPLGEQTYPLPNERVTDNLYQNNTLASPLTPEEPLGAFIGENPNGTWTLTVNNNPGFGSGNLSSWTLNLDTTNGCGQDENPAADFDGDGDSDVSVFRPSNNTWFVRDGATTPFGVAGDIPVPCDYDGDGDTDVAVFRPSVGGWYVDGQDTVFFGFDGDTPVPGDYDGDGRCDPAIFRPGVGGWYVKDQPTVFLGLTGDIPVPADYDGNGSTDVAVFRASVGGWYRNGPAPVFFGLNGDIPVPGDYDGNASADVAIYRPTVGGWYVNGQTTQFLGLSSDIPVPGDYDGNGTTDRAVFRPSTGTWYGVDASPVSFGLDGDRPLPLPAAIRQVFFP
jgi:subtilisin-like proprotein convertase family protein